VIRRIWTVVIGLEIVLVVVFTILNLQSNPAPPRVQGRSGAAKYEGNQGIRVRVPRLRGMTALAAYERLSKRDLEVGTVQPTRGPAGLVVRTDPAADRLVPTGARIDLFVGTHRERLGRAAAGPE
jgi:hypothetical protein